MKEAAVMLLGPGQLSGRHHALGLRECVLGFWGHWAKGWSLTWGSKTFTSRQQWLPFLALDTKSIHVGWEKASSDLLMQELPCPSRSVPSEDQCNQETRRVSTSWDRERGGDGTQKIELISCFSPCPPHPVEMEEISPARTRWLCLRWPNLATVSTSGAQVCPNFVQWTFNPDSPVVKYFIAANQHTSVTNTLLPFPNSEQ